MGARLTQGKQLLSTLALLKMLNLYIFYDLFELPMCHMPNPGQWICICKDT